MFKFSCCCCFFPLLTSMLLCVVRQIMKLRIIYSGRECTEHIENRASRRGCESTQYTHKHTSMAKKYFGIMTTYSFAFLTIVQIILFDCKNVMHTHSLTICDCLLDFLFVSFLFIFFAVLHNISAIPFLFLSIS